MSTLVVVALMAVVAVLTGMGARRVFTGLCGMVSMLRSP